MMMRQELVSLDYPPGATCPSHVICKPVGKRRFAGWLDDEFLGLAIERVDGMWTRKRPYDQTHPGRVDREAALLSLLMLHRRSFDESAFGSSAGPPNAAKQRSDRVFYPGRRTQ